MVAKPSITFCSCTFLSSICLDTGHGGHQCTEARGTRGSDMLRKATFVTILARAALSVLQGSAFIVLQFEVDGPHWPLTS